MTYNTLWMRRYRANHTYTPIQDKRDITAIDTRHIKRLLKAHDLSAVEVDRRLSFSLEYTSKCLSRGVMNYQRLDDLSCLLGVHVSEVVA